MNNTRIENLWRTWIENLKNNFKNHVSFQDLRHII